MRTLMTSLILLLGATGPALAEDYARGGYEDIARAAHVLEDAARHFHRQLKHDIGRHHTTRDAKRFAKAARHFHRQVERGGSYRHLREDYAELSRAYGHLRHDFAGRHELHHDRHFQADFRVVERAFYDLNRAVQYAHGRYGSDWHYDRHDRRYGGYDRGRDRYRYGDRYRDGHRSDLGIVLDLLFEF